ncbi:MAG: hypothetical protein J5645_01535 [Lachnospiraceae bacterium]|nr:hypothetical protein [Lachnospiraceae bacterium]
MKQQKETKPAVTLAYLLAAVVTACLAFLSLVGSGYLVPDEKPFANAFHGEFQKYAEETVDVNHDGVFAKEEMDAVETISLPELPDYIKCTEWNSQWLSVFPNLTTFTCQRWGIEELSLRNNPKLAVLDCSHNMIETLDLSSNTELESVDCSEQGRMEQWTYTPLMYEGMKKLILGDNPKLRVLNLETNDVAVLNLAGAPSLEVLNCRGNQLIQLDLSANTKLQELKCESNYLVVLDVSGQRELKLLYCASNILTELRLATETAFLEELDCESNYLMELDVHGSPKLWNLECGSNRLEVLDISFCPKLIYAGCMYNNNTKINAVGCSQDLWISTEPGQTVTK